MVWYVMGWDGIGLRVLTGWLGKVEVGIVWYLMVAMVWFGMGWHYMVYCGMVWYEKVWFQMGWYEIVLDAIRLYGTV